MSDWITRFMERLRRSNNPQNGNDVSFDGESIPEEPPQTEEEKWLRALEEMRVKAPDAYDYALNHLKHKLYVARVAGTSLINATYPQHVIANVAVSTGTKCRTLEWLIDDMTETISKIGQPSSEEEEDELPAALRMGS